MTVRDGLDKKYEEFMISNVKDALKDRSFPTAYTLEILVGAEMVGYYLDKNYEPQRAFNRATLGKGHTGYMIGEMARIVSSFHVRGAEFKRWWNTDWGQADAKGVVNPAILTIKNKETPLAE